MNKKKEFAKNTMILMIGRICTQFISFVLLPLYTFCLTTEEYGTVDLIITYVGLFAPIITLQLEMSVFRFLIDARKSNAERKCIISNSFFMISFILVSIIPIYLCFVSIFNFQYKIYAIFMIIATIYSNYMLQAARGIGDNVGYAIGSIVAGVGTIVFNILFLVILKMNADSILISQTLANLLTFLILSIRMKLYQYIDIKELEKKKIFELLKYSMPLVPNGIIWWIINVSDRTIISIFLGTGANGIYAIANKFSNVFIQVYGVFNMSWTESISLHLFEKDGDRFLSEMMEQLIKLFFSICTIIISGISIIFPFFINKAYHEAYYYIPLLMIGSFFTVIVSMLGAIYVAMKKTKEVAKTSLYAGILNLIINVFLIKFIGIYAAAISTVLAFLVMAVYRWFDVKKYVKLSVNLKMFLMMFIIYIIIAIMYYYDSIIIHSISFVITIVLTLILNKEVLVSIKSNFVKKIGKERKKIL